MLSFIQLRNKQAELETQQSIEGFRLNLREILSELDLEELVDEWSLYLEAIGSSDIKHSQYHYSLYQGKGVVTPNKMKKVLEKAVEEAVFNHSYLEHRILAYKIGQKLCPKTVVVGGKNLRSGPSTKLSYGANLIQFLKVQGLMTSKVFRGENKHTHNCVELSPKLISFLKEKGVYALAQRVRKGSAMFIAQNHSTDEDNGQGGSILASKTMLNTSGFNPHVVQSASVCEALNKLQRVPYKLVDNQKLIPLLKEYQEADRWYDKDGIFMSKEWNKLIDDIKRFEDQNIYFAYAMDDVGRMYDCGSYLSIQGDSYQKQMLTINGKKIIRVDAKNQSIKIYKLLGRDSTLNVDVREDLAKELNTLTNSENFTRTNVKYPLMVATYGAMQRQVLKQSKDIGTEFRNLFPEGMEDTEKYELFTKALNNTAPSVVNLMNLIYRFNLEDQTRYNFTMPDGMKVSLTTTEVVTHKGYYISVAEGVTHSVSIEAPVESNSRYNRMLAPRIIHSIDSFIAREVVRRCDFHISLIHDSFGVEEENVEKLIQTYNEVCADIAEMNLLENILEQINPKIRFRIRKGGLTRDEILNSTLMEVE